MRDTSLPPHLEKTREIIEAYAIEYGLDYFPVIYEMVDFETMNEIASYGGFPVRYPHWKFGMEYDRMSKAYAYGLQKIYELVINNDPCYAYLLNCNEDVAQKMVMAHVYGHSDFFKNNACFAHTNRKMVDAMANHGTKVRKFIEKYGEEDVEEFLDAALSLENLIDPYFFAIKRFDDKEYSHSFDEEDENPRSLSKFRFKSKPHMDNFINPKEFLKELEEKKREEEKKKKEHFPIHPYKDILLFLMEHAPLENWQSEILSIVRDEAYYFAPQRQTKIMNEGWASYWHSTIMTQKAAEPQEIVAFADLHSGTVATSGNQLNPYKIGLELFRDIEDRWNKGRFGKEYEEVDSYSERLHWDTGLGKGREKIFEVRKIYSDVMFLDEFLTFEFCQDQKLFTFEYNSDASQYEIASREFKKIKEKLLNQLTNFGQPYVEVTDGNYGNRGELFLKHRHDGVDLREDYAQATLENLYKIWKRPVNIETIVEERPKLLVYDGRNHVVKNL